MENLKRMAESLCTCHRLPRGFDPPGQPWRYVGEYKEIDDGWDPLPELAGWDWKISTWFNDQRLGGEGIHKFVKSQEGNHGDMTGIWHFSKLTHGAENREFSNKKASFEAFEKSCRHFGKTDRVWKRVFRHLVKYPDTFRIVHCVLPILICGTMEEMKVRNLVESLV